MEPLCLCSCGQRGNRVTVQARVEFTSYLAHVVDSCTGAGGVRPLEVGTGGAVPQPHRTSTSVLTKFFACFDL
jgi:hypothetical protein